MRHRDGPGIGVGGKSGGKGVGRMLSHNANELEDWKKVKDVVAESGRWQEKCTRCVVGGLLYSFGGW